VYIRRIFRVFAVSAMKWVEDRKTDVRPLCEDTNLSRARPISARTVEWVFRHSISRSYKIILVSCDPARGVDVDSRGEILTSISKFSSILTALPKMKIHCARFANSHILRMRSRRPRSLGGSTASISCRPRFLDDTISQDDLAMTGA
jgi:hypothetical protein